MTVGLFEAITSAIGEADQDISGLWITRLTSSISAGATTLPVETTLNWGETGKVGLDGIVYYYSGKTATSFTGIEYIDGGSIVSGTKIDHVIQSDVLDISRSRNAIDLVRRAMLTEYAESYDLDIIGRNYGINRLPTVTGGDDQFRDIIQALAYNPRGTVYGIELALDALVGEGNYEIYEDLIGNPCTVYIRLDDSLTITSISVGKTFLEEKVPTPSTNRTTATLTVEPETIGSVTLKDENVTTETKTAKPSTQTIVEYDGDSGKNVWTFGGTDEGTDVTVLTADGGCIELTDDYANYNRENRIQPESYVSFEMVMSIPSTCTLDGSAIYQAGAWIDDSFFTFGWGVLEAGSGQYYMALFKKGTGKALPSTFITPTIKFNKDQYYNVEIKKHPEKTLELYVDGALIEKADYKSESTNSNVDYMMYWGFIGNITPTPYMRVRQTSLYITTPVEYWDYQDTNGEVFPSSYDNRTLENTLPLDKWQIYKEGARLDISNSGITNSQGGNNNGRYIIDEWLAYNRVKLKGLNGSVAQVNSANPKRITIINDFEVFTYPDDLGKEIVLSNSSLGNDGTYIIDKLLEPEIFTDFSTMLTPGIKPKTNVCEVVTASFTTEADLEWQVYPVFVNETGLTWNTSDAGWLIGDGITLKGALPDLTIPIVLDVLYTQVLSAQLLRDRTIENEVDQGPPVIYSYYPAYLADPMAYVESYLDPVTAAGIIPEFIYD